MVMTAVASTGWALEYVTEELRRDSEVVMTAIANSSGRAVNKASEELRGDREVMEDALARASDASLHGHEGPPVGLKAHLVLNMTQNRRESPATSGALRAHFASLDKTQGL